MPLRGLEGALVSATRHIHMAPRRIEARDLPVEHPLARRLLRAAREARNVTIEHDGRPVEAREGEPLALSLAAAGRLLLARSPKYHRPRGAACLRGECDGCLVRLDDTPGVMACRVGAASGMKVTSQNAFPSAGLDVFGVTDWFFPKHMDHHNLMVGFGDALNRTMQVFARRMSGLGTLPEEASSVVAHTERDVDVLVVGAGSSGLAAARELASKGLSVLLVEEDRSLGGDRLDRIDDDPVIAPLPDSVEVLSDASAVATFDNGTLVLRGGAITRVRARARLFATGTHDLIGSFARNDLPGIFTARAFSRALTRGVLLGERVLIVGTSTWGAIIFEALTAMSVRVTWAREAELVEAIGSRHVVEAVVREGASTRALKCDALVTAEEPVSAYELAGQAGACLAWDGLRRAFTPQSDAEGATDAAGVYVAGSMRRRFASRAERADDGARVARRIARDLGGAT